jgi:NADPH-dependent ferric siderophore reductase
LSRSSPTTTTISAGLASAIEPLDDAPDALWIAGEAAAVERLRKHRSMDAASCVRP